MNGIAYLRQGKPREDLVESGRGFVIGIDGGGTKTLGAAVTLDGRVLAVARRGPSNYQSIGAKAAESVLHELVGTLMSSLMDVADLMAYAAFALSGADRDKDFQNISNILCRVIPSPGFVLCNDSLAALWAGTNGTGVALVAGTGSNCIGINASGKVAKVGGLGPLSGDVGFGEDIAMKAIAAAIKSIDGRGEPTLLSDMLCERMGIERIEDIIEFWFADSYDPPKLGELAPVVFSAAARGDMVASSIIRDAGMELGNNVCVAANRLGWSADEEFDVVFGGSLLQRPNPPLLADAARSRILNEFPYSNVIVPNVEPVVGAVALAVSETLKVPIEDEFRIRVGRQIAEILAEDM